jgi:hypothetical protein
MSNRIIIPFDGEKASDIEAGGLTMFLGENRVITERKDNWLCDRE